MVRSIADGIAPDTTTGRLISKVSEWAASLRAARQPSAFRAFAAGESLLPVLVELCAIKDVYFNRIVGYSIDSWMKASLAVSALHIALALRDPDGTVVHSDRGSQFRSNAFVRTLKGCGLKGSMGRVGACADRSRSSHSCRRSCWIASGPRGRICAWLS
jgi:transposase InsO family protein